MRASLSIPMMADISFSLVGLDIMISRYRENSFVFCVLCFGYNTDFVYKIVELYSPLTPNLPSIHKQQDKSFSLFWTLTFADVSFDNNTCPGF
ncbi:ORF17 [White sturgeon adenovirus 1]|uniref:ORF17 n=1 Tax=White sturgeon adenovirus 1 TaxID=2580388 RepID=A0A4P8PNE2_9ADEN|nr:ORF17 [White sturgeon adenovirus 1]QCQ84180.1 ORF17 [White sturgeon adenovirus 1]